MRKLSVTFLLIFLVLAGSSCGGLSAVAPEQSAPAVVSISAGGGHNAIIKADGSLWAWGWNMHGQVGDNSAREAHYRPVKVMDFVVDVSPGGFHTLAIREDGSLWAWGENSFGQLGDGTGYQRDEREYLITDYRREPFQIIDSGVSAIAAGHSTSFAVIDGVLWGWGFNYYGEVGDGTTETRNSPVFIMDSVIDVSGGISHTLALTSDGSLWAWGLNDDGQLGNSEGNALTPIFVMDSVTAISAGGYHSAAIRSDGSLWVWGSNRAGQLGDGTQTSRHDPIKTMDSVAYVSAGDSHTAAIEAAGSLSVWGLNDFGQIGDGAGGTKDFHGENWSFSATPIKIMDSAAIVSAGRERTIALKADGSLWAWGSNEDGALGIGYDTGPEALEPVQIMWPAS